MVKKTITKRVQASAEFSVEDLVNLLQTVTDIPKDATDVQLTTKVPSGDIYSGCLLDIDAVSLSWDYTEVTHVDN